MTTKKKYHYQITIQSLDPAEEGKDPEKPVIFKIENHDNIFAVIRRTRKRLHFNDTTSMSFALGLKLLTEVVLENRNDPLFSGLKPAMVEFMKKLKVQLKPALQPQFEPDKPGEGKLSDETLGIKESVEKRIQEIEEKSIAFAEIEVSSIEEMDDEMMAEFEASTYSSDGESGYQDEVNMEVEDADGMISISTISDDFSLSSRIEDTQYTLVEKIGDDGVLAGIDLIEVEEDKGEEDKPDE